MTFAPATLRQLGSYWTGQGGVNLGIVGDANHTSGYHLGKDRIYSPSGLGGADYSVRHPRDEAGLSDAAAAIDLGKLDGSLEGLHTFNRWLVRQCRDGAPGSGDVREVIYSPDGDAVLRWSGVDGGTHTGPGNGDASHRYHTHISYFRDSEGRDKTALFAPYFEGATPMLDGHPMPGGDGTVTLKPGRGYLDLVTGGTINNPTDRVKTSYCLWHLNGATDPDRADGYLVRHAQHACLAFLDAVDFVPATPGAPEPEPQPYDVIVGGKPVGSVTLP